MNELKNIKLYHKDIFLPQELIEQAIEQQRTVKNYIFTKHLIERIECKDRSHNSVTAENVWKVLDGLKKKPIAPFEVETKEINGKEKVAKYVVRAKMNELEDICLVVGGNKVITAYMNNSSDNHRTLDYSRYEKF